MKYSFFTFDDFKIDITSNRLLFHYSFDDVLHFEHELTLDLSTVKDPQEIEAAVFAVGMAEIPSYYKNFCPPKIIIKAGKLNSEQVAFWAKLYEKGLGEFFYKNQIDFRDLINIEVAPTAPDIHLATRWPSGEKYLVPVGGGKDSLVTTEMLKGKGKDFTWFMLEPLPLLAKLQEVAGVENVITIGRSVEKNFGSFKNFEGAYNGHVPITAVYIFSAALAAQIHGFKYVALSIERSAEEGNLTYLGNEINHQYSKTFEFEKAAHEYIQKHINPELYVFSLLRNLYEVHIFERFVKYEKYFPYFISCNRGLKIGKWCGECAKCAFVFMGLAAFLPLEKVVEIFGKNLFKDLTLEPIFQEFIGHGSGKPFDCVGTYEENTVLLYRFRERTLKDGKPLPAIFSKIDVSRGEVYEHVIAEPTTEHLIPKELLV